MTKPRYDYQLDEEELAIQKEMDEYLLAHPEILQWAHKTKPEVIMHTELARQTMQHYKKTKSITIRISEYDLIKLKSKAITLGIPYQTLIGSQIRQFVNS